jgi:hypothetical protein
MFFQRLDLKREPRVASGEVPRPLCENSGVRDLLEHPKANVFEDHKTSIDGLSRKTSMADRNFCLDR